MPTPEQLSQEQIAQCARIVTGENYVVEGVVNKEIRIAGTCTAPRVWMPTFTGTGYWRRSQALTIVEWLLNKIDVGNGEFNWIMERRARKIINAIQKKDTTALMALVLELQK